MPDNPSSNPQSEESVSLLSSDLVTLLSRKVVGQSAATKAIVPYVYMYKSGLAPEGRPAGVFLLLGPTGTGKTKTVEAIAELLHGSEKKIVKIDCGEFQMEHELAKLIGAPDTKVILMTGGGLSEDELLVCQQRDLPVLFKTFRCGRRSQFNSKPLPPPLSRGGSHRRLNLDIPAAFVCSCPRLSMS